MQLVCADATHLRGREGGKERARKRGGREEGKEEQAASADVTRVRADVLGSARTHACVRTDTAIYS
jgi:hypothetical protein